MAMTMLDYINSCIDQEKPLTVEEFTRIRNYGTEEELQEALEKMEAAGGYENLE